MARKWSQGDPKWSQNWPKMEPKSRKMRWTAHSGYQMAPKTTFCRNCRPLLPIFGSPLGPKNRPKMHVFWKIGARRRRFHRFFRDFCVFTLFWLIFGRFSWKKTMFFLCFFRSLLVFLLQPGNPHETLCFTVFRAFFRFSVFRFFAEKVVKNRFRNGMLKKHQKSFKNYPRNHQKWCQNNVKVLLGGLRSPKKQILEGFEKRRKKGSEKREPRGHKKRKKDFQGSCRPASQGHGEG